MQLDFWFFSPHFSTLDARLTIMPDAGVAVGHRQNPVGVFERAGNAGAAVVLEHRQVDQLQIRIMTVSVPDPLMELNPMASYRSKAWIGDI